MTKLKKKIKLGFLIISLMIYIICTTENVIAQPMNDSTKSRSIRITLVEKNLRDHSVYYLQLGYFPRTEDFYSGLSYVFGKEFQVARYLNFGWRVQVLSTFEEINNFSGLVALFMTFDNDFKLINQLFFIRGGAGLMVAIVGIMPSAFLEFEYVVHQFNGFALSLSVSQSFFRFSYLGPTIFSVGILF
jgi:hypothetical protein